MYKKVKQYAQNMGLAVDERAGLSYGLINGYFVLIEQCPGTDAKHNVYLWAKPGNILSPQPITAPRSLPSSRGWDLSGEKIMFPVWTDF